MPERIGLTNCPICGAETEVKINKNRKLYAFCDFGCSFKMNANLSREGIAKLTSGNDVKLGNIIIRPLERTNVNDNRTDKPASTGIDTGRRIAPSEQPSDRAGTVRDILGAFGL